MDESARNALWGQYSKNRSAELREQLILEYAPLVKLVAGRLSMYLGFNVEYDDLVGYGIFGLIDAIDKFDTMKDVKFETYASLRIRGAILDQIRKMDWIPRTVRQRQRKIDQAIREIEAETGRVATDKEIAERMEITEDEYLDWQSQMKVTGVISLNEFVEQGSDIPEDPGSAQARFEHPEDAVEKKEIKKMLAEALELLSEREKRVIVMYYYEEMTLKEIAAVLEVTESRISQLHTRALQKMKQKMGVYMGILSELK
ncbi:MAG: FliA/WhiG family RNA polymerase sigma factor [Lachnospiraceae bacterium]|nr:FliA/WhiG family RNA polymerase sigma factor [Lachnospiraceae bacterium]